MEEYLLDYLFEASKNKLLKGNDYPVLSYLLQKSLQEGFTSEVKVTSLEASEHLGMTSPTFNKCIDNLQFSGYLTSKSFSGRNGYTEVKINFISDLLKTSMFDEDSSRNIDDVFKKHCPNAKKYLQSKVIRAKKSRDTPEIKYKDVLQFTPLKYKDSLQYRLQNIKKFYNLFHFNIKEFYNLDAKYKTSLQFNPLKYKVSLHFMSDAKSLDINDLTSVTDERYQNIRSFFAKMGTIYNRRYIQVINVIDILFFDGRLFDGIENVIIEEKASKATSKYSSKPFQLNEETEKLIPLHLHEHSEKIHGESITFMKSIENWINYKSRRGSPPGYDSMIRNIKWLSRVNNPVECIETSIQKEANGIFKVSQDKNFGSGSNNSNSNAGNVVGRIRKFE